MGCLSSRKSAWRGLAKTRTRAWSRNPGSEEGTRETRGSTINRGTGVETGVEMALGTKAETERGGDLKIFT